MDENCKHECDYTCVAINSALIPRKVEGSAGAQFVGQSDTPFFDFSDSTRMSITQTGDPGQCSPQWWLMEVFVRDLQADAVNGGPGFRQAVPAWSDIVGSHSRGSGGARLLVHAEGDLIRLDVGHGNRFSFFSDMVSVELEVPRGAIAIGSGSQGGNNGVKNVQGGRLHNVAVFVNIHSNVAPLGQRTGRLTQSIVNPGGLQDPLHIPIPDRAIGVEFFTRVPGGADSASLAWDSADGVSNSNLVRGTVDFVPGIHQSGLLKIPGNAAVVDIGTQARTVTAVWCLEI